MLAISSRTSTVALPRCGTSTTFFSCLQFGVHLRLVLEHVEPGAGDLLCSERPHQRRFVDDRAARGIDDEGGLLHQSELARADLVAGLRVERRVQRDEIGFAQQARQAAQKSGRLRAPRSSGLRRGVQ